MTDSIGQLLRQRREARRMDLEQAAQVTHIRLRYLQALENVNFTKLRKIVGQDNGGKDTEEIRN